MATTAEQESIFTELYTWGSLVRFSHTIFALPFALSVLVLTYDRVQMSAAQIAWILLALVAARTAAMSYNRLVDREIDAHNPRTRERELPAGKLSVLSVYVLCFLSSFLFLYAAWLLGLHCFVLAPFVLTVLFFYSWTKRFTTLAHFILGLALALAPGGVWYALTAEFSIVPVPLMCAVLLWVAGFDILYSCQDTHFDQAYGLFSVPARYGIPHALRLARLLHLTAFLLLVMFGIVAQLGKLYYGGLAIFTAVLFSQHRLISEKDLSRVNAAFFTRNGCASILFFLAVLADRFFR